MPLKRKIYIYILFSSVFILYSQNCLSADKAHTNKIEDLLWPTINFVIFISFIIWRLKRPLSEHFKDYYENVQRNLDLTERKHLDAVEVWDKQQKKIDGIQQEVIAINKEIDNQIHLIKERAHRDITGQIKKVENDAINLIKYERLMGFKQIGVFIVEDIIKKTKNYVASKEDKQFIITNKILMEIKNDKGPKEWIES